MAFQGKSILARQYDTYDFISPQRFTGELKGKVALITGASAGLGKAACLAFAAAGASVACVARRKPELDTLVAEIKEKHRVPALAVQADVSDPASTAKIPAQVEEELGPIDILLQCAGITRFGPFALEEDFATWWRVLEVNLRGPVALTHAVLPSMIARKGGFVIAVSSLAGSMDVPLAAAYSTSKAAIIKFQQDLAGEVQKDGILCYAVNLGTVATDLSNVQGAINMKAMDDPEVQRLLQEHNDIEFQTPELFADSCVALCGDERFRALTGKLIDVEQPLDKVLEEVEKADRGKIGKDNLYHLKVDYL